MPCNTVLKCEAWASLKKQQMHEYMHWGVACVAAVEDDYEQIEKGHLKGKGKDDLLADDGDEPGKLD